MPPSLSDEFNLRRAQLITRRSLFGNAAAGLGGIALGNLLGQDAQAASSGEARLDAVPNLRSGQGLPGLPIFISVRSPQR